MNTDINMKDSYKTKDGEDVIILSINGPSSDYPVVGYRKGSTDVMTWTKDGKHCDSSGCEYDLIKQPKEIEGWINIYSVLGAEGLECYAGARISPTKAKSDFHGININKRIACIKIKFTPGEGLENNG